MKEKNVNIKAVIYLIMIIILISVIAGIVCYYNYINKTDYNSEQATSISSNNNSHIIDDNIKQSNTTDPSIEYGIIIDENDVQSGEYYLLKSYKDFVDYGLSKDSYLYEYLNNDESIEILLPEQNPVFDGVGMYITDITKKVDGNYIIKYKVCHSYSYDPSFEELLKKKKITLNNIKYSIKEKDGDIIIGDGEYIVSYAEMTTIVSENPQYIKQESTIEISKDALIDEVHMFGNVSRSTRFNNISELYEDFKENPNIYYRDRLFDVIVKDDVGVELFYYEGSI